MKMIFNLLKNVRLNYTCMVCPNKQFYSSTPQRAGKIFGTYNIVKPEYVTAKLKIPEESGIVLPNYYLSGEPDKPPEVPDIKTSFEIKLMHESCKLARFVLDCVAEHIKENMTTNEIDLFAHELIVNNGAYPSPLNYRGFPKSICTSVNNVACHGIPDSRPLENGDIINIDITVYLNGFHGDCSATFCIGDVDEAGRDLVNAAQQALHAAISVVKPGEYFSTIGSIIENTARKAQMNVIPSIAGHGIGSYFHGPPDIYHTLNDYPGKMEPGMTFTIEPALTHGSSEILLLEDGWTAVTVDHSRSAQFEHTVLVTENGYKVLTY